MAATTTTTSGSSNNSSSSSLKPLSQQEWESLIDDYNNGRSTRLHRWANSNYTIGPPLLDLALSSLLRKDLSLNLKLNLLIFLEERSDDAVCPTLSRLLETLRSIIQSPLNDAVSLTFSFKEQCLISATSIFISAVGELKLSSQISQLEGLVELLLMIMNRPNHGVDRQTRGVACECLRELEIAFPRLLSQILPHLWALCQNERTHASQSYLLLLSTVVHNIVVSKNPDTFMPNSSSVPLIPFSVPRFLTVDDEDADKSLAKDEEMSSSSFKELRRVIAFLLEWPQNLTPSGLLEFMVLTVPVAKALDLQVSLLKVQFAGLIYTYEPLLWHAFLGMYLRFSDSFEGQEVEVARRLLLVSKESQQHLVFRILALHWLLGLIGLVSSNRDVVWKMKNAINMTSSFYPNVFDSLAIKSLKLDLLAYLSVLLGSSNGVVGEDMVPEVSVVKLLEEGLVCVSAFKWLPPWSTETAVAFRTLHKFLIGASCHLEVDSYPEKPLPEPTIFHTIQIMLVDWTTEFQGLVPVIVAFVDRLLRCLKHQWLGETILETFDEHLLQKLKIDHKFGSYFPIFERMAETVKVSPNGLIKLLLKFMTFLVEKHGPDTGLRSWCLGSEVLSICRIMLIHHHGSRIFSGLSHLFGFACLYFPDLEVRDNARIYLRMLICIPGKKLREVLNVEEQLPGITPTTQSTSFFNLQFPRISHDQKRPKNISNYIHLQRMVPLLVKQSWSLSLSTLGIDGKRPAYLEGIVENESTREQKDMESSTSMPVIEGTNRIDQPQEPLRVIDSKILEIVEILRKHFSSIPDFRHMSGLRIKIPCSLRFESDPFIQIWGTNSTSNCPNGADSLPAMYAIVLKFSSSAPYGSIPSCHIPFLLGQAPKNDSSKDQSMSLDIVPVGYDSTEEESFGTPVIIDLEPREPIPGLVDVLIEANTGNGQIIRGKLQSINVGIEDMFLQAIVPEDFPRDALPTYYVDLFNALWEACGTSASIGRETFVLKGGKGLAAISGTRSVKLLEVPVISLVQAVERCLARFVVCVIGEPLFDIVKDREVFNGIVWKDSDSDSSGDVVTSKTSYHGGPLYLKYTDEEDERGSYAQISNKNLGCFLILIFLPPRFHLLFRMEVSDVSTLVRIRTDHWPCLAYIDDYLEALFSE